MNTLAVLKYNRAMYIHHAVLCFGLSLLEAAGIRKVFSSETDQTRQM